MRLNKKRLAALAMSAVMAASAVPFPVYAEELSAGEDVVVSSEVVAEPTTEAVVETPEVGKAAETIDETSITFYYNSDADYGVEFDWKDATGVVVRTEKWTQADTGAKTVKKETVDATCTHGTQVVLKATINGKEWSDTVKEGTDLADHEYERKENVTRKPTCTATGEAKITWVCKHCQKVDPTRPEETVTLDKVAHNFTGETTYEVNTNWNTKLDDNGKPVLIDNTSNGYYYTVQTCTVCGTVKTKVELKATEFKYAYVDMDDKGTVNIKTNVNTLINGNVAAVDKLQKDGKTIELKDCEKDGAFVVKYYRNIEDKNNGENPVATETITVKAHHYKTHKAFVFKSAEDKNKVEIKYDKKTDTYTLTNKSCYETIEYKEVSLCDAFNCKYEAYTLGKGEVTDYSLKGHAYEIATKELKPEGAHQIDSEAKRKVEAAVKNGNVNFKELYEAIGNSKYVKVEAPENVCEKGGVVKVNYLCMREENTVAETQEVTVLPGPHKEGVPAIENKVVATCEHGGSYDLVTRCVYCDKELSKTTEKTARLAHTNENAVADKNTAKDTTTTLEFVGDKLVDENGYYLEKGNWTISVPAENTKKTFTVGKTAGFNITGNIYTNCKECNNHKVSVGDQSVKSLKVVEIQKEDSKGQNGYIVLEAVIGVPTEDKWENNPDNKWKEVKVTSAKIPYYSSMSAYEGRVEDAVLNGLHKDEDGVYRYYVNGELQKDYTGMITDNGEKYLVVKGVLATDIDGLWFSDVDKVWYFFVEGHVRADYTGIALYDGEWFYVTNGKLDEGVTGLVPYNGGTFLFTDGRLRNDVNGLWQDINNPADWYFLALGQVQNQYSGVAQYDGAFFVVKNGKLDTSYNGTIKYDGKTFKVVNGQLITK